MTVLCHAINILTVKDVELLEFRKSQTIENDVSMKIWSFNEVNSLVGGSNLIKSKSDMAYY